MTLAPVILAALCVAFSPVSAALAAPASDPANPRASDALILAMRLSSGSSPDRALVRGLENLLPQVRGLHPMFDSVRARPDFEYRRILVQADDDLGSRWRQGRLRVGDHLLDSLATALGLVEVLPAFVGAKGKLGEWFALRFAEDLNMDAVAEQFQRSPAIYFAELSGYVGDGDNIWAVRDGRGWRFVFSRGWGDCPAGCIGRRSLFVAVDSSGRARRGPVWPPPPELDQPEPPPQPRAWDLPRR